MRLLDRILTEGYTTHRADFPSHMRQWLASMLESAQLVLVDNVAAYHSQELERKLERNEDQRISVSDFPNVMLPFESTFIEMRVRNHPELQISECGVLATMSEQLKVDVSGLSPATQAHTKEVLAREDARYILTFFFFQYGRAHGKKPEWQASFMFPVGAEGQILASRNGEFPLVRSVYFPPGLPLPSAYANWDEVKNVFAMFILSQFIHPFLLSLSFMHCRNVKMCGEQAPEKLSRKHEKRTGRPLLKYHVLQIDHMKQVLEKEGSVGSLGLKKALHICRGHFKHYGRDGKGLLFGKHAGTVWVPMHTRGSPEEGVVVKDYNVS